MIVKKGMWIGVCLVLALAAGTAAASETELDPLLQLLVDRGVITLEQALDVQRAQHEQELEEETPAPVATSPAAEAAPEVSLPPALQGFKVGTLAYLSYQDGSDATGEDFSHFRVKRAYVDIRKKINDTLEVRVTPDAHQDETGDYKLRLKYLYARFGWDQWGMLNDPHVEFGLAHMPWLDFEEHINLFRMQDTMFMERNGLFNSADMGVLFGAKLGPDLPAEHLRYMNSHYAGRWGSFGVGVYNGGGYHAAERNDNKALEGRLTLRPMPRRAPGLQASVFGITGEGNVSDDDGPAPPDFEVLAAMLSYEHPRFVLTAQLEDGKGNQKGSAVGADGRALPHDGYSFFGELRLDEARRWSLIGRYDRFDTNSDDPDADVRERLIGGVAWQFAKGNYWVLDYDRLSHSVPGLETEDRIQLTLQLKY